MFFTLNNWYLDYDAFCKSKISMDWPSVMMTYRFLDQALSDLFKQQPWALLWINYIDHILDSGHPAARTQI